MLRKQIQEIEGAGAAAPVPVEQGSSEGAGSHMVTVPPWLRSGLPGFRKGRATVMDAPATALIHVIAAATATENVVALVNCPEVSLAAIAAIGGDVDRLIVVPDAGDRTVPVLLALLDGVDVVVYGSASGDEERSIMPRLRDNHGALLLYRPKRWSRAFVRMTCQTEGFAGIGRGSGRIRAVEVSGTVWGKGMPPRRLSAMLGEHWERHMPSPACRGKQPAVEQPGHEWVVG